MTVLVLRDHVPDTYVHCEEGLGEGRWESGQEEETRSRARGMENRVTAARVGGSIALGHFASRGGEVLPSRAVPSTFIMLLHLAEYSDNIMIVR